MKTLQEVINESQLSFKDIKNKYKNEFEQIFNRDKDWLINIEEKTYRLNQDFRSDIEYVIENLKNDEYKFTENDTPKLAVFTSQINSILRIANRINNFKEGTKLDNDKELKLYELFNKIKDTDKFIDFDLNLNKNLKTFVVHIFSIIKHCQYPDKYPLYYKYWKNIVGNIIKQNDDYDSLCDFYRTFETPKHLNFATYFGTIGTVFAQKVTESKLIKEQNDKTYNKIKNDILSLPRYFDLITGYKRIPNFYIIGSKYGENNDVDIFPQMIQRKVVATGFASQVDLNDFYLTDETEIVEFLKDINEPRNSYNALKLFLNIKEGDKIAIKASGSPKGSKGFLSIVGIFEVAKDGKGNIYNYDKNGLGHTLNVKIINAPIYEEFELGGYGSTVHKLSKEEHINKIFKQTFTSSNLNEDISNTGVNMDFPLNTILYGPPGTGKTYNTVLRAAEIIENKEFTTYDEALKVFNMNLHDRIEFITFHQNYSYEDFIQGLRPETDNQSALVFDKKDGIFKKIADKALKNLELSKVAPEQLSRDALFNKALDLFVKTLEDNDENYPITKSAYIFEVEEDLFRYTGETWANQNGLRMKFDDLKEFYRNNIISRKEIKHLTKVSGLAKQHATYYFSVYNEILKHLPIKTETTPTVEEKKFVIIIDEINRANISRVFGELITLIEPDKRSHGKIPMSVKLPSGDIFIVPSNLYIIGTMNTADKSIALLDIALRRRFEFESMYPKYEIKNQEIYDKDILKKINDQIIKSKGHDFQIGHAYFMGDNKDLIKRMNKKVIPLLLEYYMNDQNEVKKILENSGLNVDANSWPLKILGKK